MLEKYFKLKEHNTTVKQEVIAGLTTFLTMAYILAVNPNILSASGMSANAVFVATAIASAIATFIMAFLANYPIGLSAGLGLNAYFAYTVCLGELAGEEDPFRIALTAVFVEGILFILLSFLSSVSRSSMVFHRILNLVSQQVSDFSLHSSVCRMQGSLLPTMLQ